MRSHGEFPFEVFAFILEFGTYELAHQLVREVGKVWRFSSRIFIDDHYSGDSLPSVCLNLN